VLAQPASLAYRARKFYLRHRLGVWSGTAAACSVIGLGAATVMTGIRAQTESGRAIASRDFVVQLFRLADPEQSGGREMSPRELLEAGRRKALDTFGSQPRLQADVLRQIGVMQGYAGDFKQADVNLSQAVELLARDGRNRDWAEAQIKLAHNAIFLGDLSRASAAITAVGARLDAFRGDTALLASYLTVKGIVARSSLDVPGAIDDLSRAVALSTQARGERHVDTIDALRALADAHTESGHFAEAISLLDDASRRAHANPDVGRRDLLAIDADAAITSVQAGRYAGSAERLKGLIARCESEFGRGGEPCVGLVNYLSWLALRLDDRETSRSLVARLLEIAADDASPWRQAGSANLCAEFLAVEGSLDAHPSLLAQIHRIAHAAKLPPRDRTSATLVLARAALQKGHWNSAEAEANRALDDQHAQARPHLDLVAKAKLMRGLARHFRQRHDEALRDIQDAVADMTRARGKDHALVPLYRSNEFIVLNAMNQPTEARRTLEWALETMVPAYGNAPVVERLRRLLAAPEAQSQNPDLRQLRDIFL
jgi:serine/threonine-protein kinase